MKPEDLQRLVTLAMPKPQNDLSGQYLDWFARKGFPPGETGRLLALMQELDQQWLGASSRSPARAENLMQITERVAS